METTAFKKSIWLVLVGTLLFVGCAAGPNITIHTPAADGSLAGFWLGLWQGTIAPIVLIISLFNESVSIYEVHNNGGWYNTGYMIGAYFFSWGMSGIIAWSIAILMREIMIVVVVIAVTARERIRRWRRRISAKLFPSKE
jgi:hypothetical protein